MNRAASFVLEIDPSVWIVPLVAVAGLAVAVATFVLGLREFRRGELVRRIGECESDRADLRRQVADLRDENLSLMKRLVRLENGK